eukprot:TRINITY_DN301_c0_g1_i2.p1 TRINITY_DN301_c0_g1~~TRINITY_DN301_c0_g1_i2.p1  ORF type:complete len:342 (+),score=16.46 TRINITY_DN301_c0_g1_i2:520-1545(+)
MLQDFALIPEELWRTIFWKIDTMTIARVGLTSNQWKTLIWRFTVQLEFGHDTGDTGLFRRLISFTSLERLTIYSSEVANRALLRLGRVLVNLKHLDLSGCEELTDQALGSISCLGNLRTLNLHDCSSLTAKGFRSALQPLTQLESINLTDTRVISRDSLPALTRLARSLRSLVLANCDVTNPILKQLAELSELTRLDLSECHSVTDAAMDVFSHLPNLMDLTLTTLPITSVGLRNLSFCKNLEFLSLMGCEELTDDAMMHIAQLPRLRELNLWGCDKITDIGVKQYICKVQTLEVLHVEFCHKLTDDSVRALTGMPHIHYIGHNGCPHITPSTVKSLLELW